MTDRTERAPRGWLLWLRPPPRPRPLDVPQAQGPRVRWRPLARAAPVAAAQGYDLTENEAKVAWLVSWFKTSEQIAEALTVGRSAVTVTIGRLLRKFDVRSRRQLFRMVRCLVDGEPPPAGI